MLEISTKVEIKACSDSGSEQPLRFGPSGIHTTLVTADFHYSGGSSGIDGQLPRSEMATTERAADHTDVAGGSVT